MTDLTSLGYPQGYHLGVSSLLWWIFVIVIMILGAKLYLNAKKSELINVKEMLRAKSFLYICTSIGISLTQVGVFFPDVLLQFYVTGAFFSGISSVIYYYYWEKNLTSIKRIPTISTGISTIILVIILIGSIFFPDLPNFLLNFLTLTNLLLVTIAFILYIYLIYGFSRDVKGGLITRVGWIWMGGMVLALLALFFDNIPSIFPTFVVFYVSPLFYMIGNILAFYGITKLFVQISSFYAQTQRCAVHRGTIEKGNPIYYCSSCGIAYCETCFTQVIKRDGCWNCRKGVELENEKEQIIIKGSDLDKTQKLQDPQKSGSNNKS